MSWFVKLEQQLRAEGQDPHVLTSDDGKGRLLVTRHGARVLAADIDATPLSGNPFFCTDHSGPGGATGHHTGGDRLWIAPEVGWFWPSLAEARRDPKHTAATPADIDPGRYEASLHQGTLTLRNDHVALHDVRSHHRGDVRVHRGVRVIQTPELAIQAGVSVLGFSITNRLELLGGNDGLVAGAWDILMVPPTGTLICPTACDVRDLTVTGHSFASGPRSYYDPFGDRHVAVEPRRVRFLIDGRRRIKMGMPAEATTGRMGYLRPLGDGASSLIVRVFAPLPGEPYCDIPRDAPDSQRLGGDALQAYNDDGDAFPGTTFGEMEYHDPCLIAGRGPTAREAVCVTHLLIGPDAAVRRAGERLLGCPIDPIA